MLPVKKVILYKHGVGYFERHGVVEGDTAIDLQFKADEMNDVLKSLTVLDLGEGLISSISYESTKPIEKQLEDIAIRLPDDNALTALLAQIKGAQVAVEAGSRTVEGVVIGTETVTRRADGETLWSQHLSLLVDGVALESFDLLEIKRIVLLDDNLKRDLQHLLDTLLSTKKKDLKRLTIFARGEQERSIVASYIVETPVWKTSYRVLLGEREALIQGWALVDNTQDEDWQDVSLTLVAGLPISFVHDLYSPRYKRRPVVQVQEEAAYAPPVLEEALDELAADGMDSEFDDQRTMAASIADMQAFARETAAPAPAAAPPPARPRLAAMRRAVAVARSVDVQTRTVEVGDLFQYEIQNPVTVKRNQSALVPILQRPFEGKRVAVYNPEVRDKNPMSAVLFHNTTEMTLEGGPVTILEEQIYVGEAMLETLKPDEERLVPFSVELGCLITVDSESDLQEVHFARLSRGTLVLHRHRVERTVYAIRSKLQRELDLFLEHRFREGWELVDTPRPVEKTESFYRFRVDVPAGKTTRFEVREKGDEFESWQIRDVEQEQIGLWLEAGYIDEPTRDRLQALTELNERLSSLSYWISERSAEINEIFQNQERLRENLQALGTSRDEQSLRERYVASLAGEEDRLRDIKGQIQQWREQKGEVEAQIDAMLKEISHEVEL